MQNYKKLSIVLVVLLCITALMGCQTAEKPVPSQPPANKGENVNKPAIPKAISQGEGKEPKLKVYLKDTGEIKEMPLEEYLAGVVAGEMQNDFPDEALKAQVILARTFVMEFVTEEGTSKYKGAHVSTDIEEAQAWNAKAVNDKIKAAVKNTRGQVLVNNGKYIKSWFFAHAGGKTATAKEGLGYEKAEPPYIKVVESPDSKEAPKEDAVWTATFTKGEIQAALKKLGKQTGDFSAITIAKKGPSGRATELKIGKDTIPAPAFRVALDSMKMKSTLLESITVSGDKVTMKGKGYGHGVGMSQWGAFGMAKEGKKASDIITHYFKDVQLVKLWE